MLLVVEMIKGSGAIRRGVLALLFSWSVRKSCVDGFERGTKARTLRVLRMLLMLCRMLWLRTRRKRRKLQCRRG